MLSDLEELPSVRLGEFILRFELEDLTPQGKEAARTELRETPEVKAKAVEELKKLLQGKLDSPNICQSIY
jgi:hypothetical protein